MVIVLCWLLSSFQPALPDQLSFCNTAQKYVALRPVLVGEPRADLQSAEQDAETAAAVIDHRKVRLAILVKVPHCYPIRSLADANTIHLHKLKNQVVPEGLIHRMAGQFVSRRNINRFF